VKDIASSNFLCPSIRSSSYNIKIPPKKFGQKMEKNVRGTPSIFSNFEPKTFCWIFVETFCWITVVGWSCHQVIQSKVDCEMLVFSSNLPAVNCPLSRSILNRRMEQETSVLTFSSVPQWDPIVKTLRYLKKKWAKKLKKNVGVPLAFFWKFSIDFFFCLILNVWWLGLIERN